MDGNRRWAREQDLQTLEGHKKGGEVFADSVEWVRDAQISHAVYYAFSTENWKRTEKEVSYLMDLFFDWFSEVEKRFVDGNKNVQFKFVGYRKDFSEKLQNKMIELETKSSKFKKVDSTIWIALSYGGRAEIIEAVNKAVEKGEKVDEDSFNQLLWTAEMPDPDIIVRTSGEQRLSNFVTWKSVYSEFLFLNKHWPALTKKDFEYILNEYESRERRKGK